MPVTTLREAVAAWLRSTAALVAVSPRVYFAVPSQVSLYPCTVLKVPDRSYGHNLAGADGTSRATIEFTALALQQAQCIALAEAIRNVADGFRGTKSGVGILRYLLMDEADDQTAPPDGSDRWIYSTTLEYRCDHWVPYPALATQATPTPAAAAPPASLPWPMVSAADHETASSTTPTVLLYRTGGDATWAAPQGPVTYLGDGTWSLAPSAADVAGGTPLLLYATAPGADAAPATYWTGPGGGWAAGSTAHSFPIWIGTAASSGHAPDPGDPPSIRASFAGAALATATGTVSEPGGAGQGHGFYLYAPAAGDVAAAGDLVLYATSARGQAAWFDYSLT